ncbi:MAG: HlyD family secretion protein [Hyphomicrobiaceae bacterium]
MLERHSMLTTVLAASTITGLVVAGIHLFDGSSTRTTWWSDLTQTSVTTLGTNATNAPAVRLAQATPTTGSEQNASQSGQTERASVWAATAAGRVEPRGGEIAITPEASGLIVGVYAKVGQSVRAGDLLVQLKEDELEARRDGVLSEIDVRRRERAEDPAAEEDAAAAQAAEPRREAEDAVFEAELALHAAKRARDRTFVNVTRGTATPSDLEAARTSVDEAKLSLTEKKEALATERAKDDMPLPTRLEGSLESARNELRLIEVAFDRMRIRAPVDGTLLALDARIGELAVANPARPIARIGDLSNLTVRSELEERDMAAVQVGQPVIVKSSAFPGRDFEGRVSQVAPALAPPKLSGRGPLAPADVDVLEVTIDLEGSPPLVPGMRVDVFFRPIDARRQAASN